MVVPTPKSFCYRLPPIVTADNSPLRRENSRTRSGVSALMAEAATLIESALGFIEIWRGIFLHLDCVGKQDVVLQVNVLMQVNFKRIQRLIALDTLKMLAGRLRKCAELVEALSLREVDQRLARWLIIEARARGRHTDVGLEVTLALTNQQIAARIGSVREVVSRALSRLQQNGLIMIDGRRITIGDEQAMEVFCRGLMIVFGSIH
jgi:CRP-like cAMP-binding protein